MAILETARAKINLTLRVLGRRPDGYHEIESLVAFADVGDGVVFTPGPTPGVSVAGPFAAAIVGENLVMRALMLAAEAAPRSVTGHVHIDKRLPVAAGIGGGSADAAAVLRALRRANPECSTVDWMGLAARLGADVPACVVDRPLVMRGIGERIETIDLPVFDAVLVTPDAPVPLAKTAAVFKAFNAPMAVATERGQPARLTRAADWLNWLDTTANDLEPAAAAVMPAVGEVMIALRRQAGARCVRLSGAGPTCLALFADASSARNASMRLAAAHPGWWCVATRLGADADRSPAR